MAENNQTLFVSGVYFKISSMSSLKPIFSISSASSSTTNSISFNLITLRFMRSMSRPGVATIISTPFRMSVICFLMSTPPYTETTFTFKYLPKIFKSLEICKQSSRVGHIITAVGYSCPGSMRLNKGKPKAAVLPVPVCARPTKSLSSWSRCGIACSWMGVGSVYPSSLIDCSTSFRNPNASNVIDFF